MSKKKKKERKRRERIKLVFKDVQRCTYVNIENFVVQLSCQDTVEPALSGGSPGMGTNLVLLVEYHFVQNTKRQR